MFAVGQNPATSLNAAAQRTGDAQARLARRQGQLAHRDGHVLEERPGDRGRQRQGRRTSRPKCSFCRRRRSAENEGSFTNTQRMLQWHFKAADPPGDCRTDMWFYYQLGKRLKKLYANSTLPRDEGWKHLVWDYERDPATGREPGSTGEPDAAQDPARDQRLSHRRSDEASRRLRRAQGRWLDDVRELDLLRRVPVVGENLAGRREPDPPGNARRTSELGLGVARQPAAALQPRVGGSVRGSRGASANGGSGGMRARRMQRTRSREDHVAGQWVGYDVPDFALHEGARGASETRTASGSMRSRAPIRSS